MGTEPTESVTDRGVDLTAYLDYTCPFSYLAQSLVERLERDGVRVRWRGFQLRPAGTPLPPPDAEPFGAAWTGVVVPLAEALGVEVRRPRAVPRTQKAHEAAAFARERNRFEDYRRALFRAFFVEGRDIGRIDVLAETGAAIGLDLTALKIALDIDAFAGAVADDEAAAIRAGVGGVPAFVGPGETVEGLQPYGVLLALARGRPTR